MHPTPPDPISAAIPPDVLAGRRLVLGVSGSIAAYKALGVASRLTQAGARVDVVLTPAAAEMVRPLAFQALTHRPVVAGLWDPKGPLAMDHIALAQAAEALVVAPATADVIARLALGLADDALATTALATRAPLVLAPAMEPDMWAHPATQGHVATLVARGAHLAGPVAGRLASGKHGEGRMVEPEMIVEHIRWVLGRGGPLAGRRVLVTAGPTREPLDPVRFLSNHSSGTMGYAVACAARDAGAAVTLVSGPVSQAPPVGAEIVGVETAREMCGEVLDRAEAVDVVIMAAAVADYRPAEASDRKIKKAAGDAPLTLVRNPDILCELDTALAGVPPARRPVRVGFAAETENLVPNAAEKRLRKGLDLVVANPVPESFGAEQSTAVFVEAAGVTEIGPRAKSAIAHAIIAWVAAHLAERKG